jgi:aminopeptidase N
MFGFLVYDGGALVLHALRLALGDEAFFSTLQTWVSENTGTSRTTEDFVEHVRTKNPDLDEGFFAEWLYAETVPTEFPG